MLTIVVIDHGPNESVEYRAYNGTGDGLSGWQTKGLLAVVGDDIQGSVRREGQSTAVASSVTSSWGAGSCATPSRVVA